MDTGAELFVIGKQQAMAYRKCIGQRFELIQNLGSIVYKFKIQRAYRLGSFKVLASIKDTNSVEIKVGLADIDVFLTIGLEVMLLFKVIIDIPQMKFVSSKGNWEIPLVLKKGHFYIEWT